MNIRSCRVCGCTDDYACLEADGWPCCWVERDLCSSCAYRPENGKVTLPEEQLSFSTKEG